MWCANCRADVAAEVSSDNRHVNCATCGGPIATPLSGRTLSRTQQARELLERWSLDRKSEPLTATANAANEQTRTIPNRPATVYAIRQDETAPAADLNRPAAAQSSGPAEAYEQPRRSRMEPPSPHLRMDGGHRTGESSGADRGSEPTRPAAGDVAIVGDAPSARAPRLRGDSRHALTGPHVAIPARPPIRWVPLVGQSLAYIGVLGLMAGACLVILGHFRGPATYAPTGWLITMAGQMLLFLGVVTLVSTGMEETTNTVASRIDRLDEKLLRIERATSRLGGPSGGTDNYSSDPPSQQTTSPQREISRAG